MYDTYTQTLKDQMGQLSKLLGGQAGAPMMSTMKEAPAMNPFDCVDGIEGARAFLGKMLASTKHIVWDSQRPVFYVLQKDANGNAARIQICNFTVELEPTMEEKYVTREDFNARDLDRIPGFYNGPKQGYAWCDVFYDWLLVAAFGPARAQRMLCQPKDSAGAGCLYSATYYQEAGRFNRTAPEAGDQIFFTYSPGEVSHTGIVERVSDGVVYTIEGNSSDGVVRRSYEIGSGQIYGFGRPQWGLVGDVSESNTPPPPGTAADTEPGTSEPAPDPEQEYQITLPVIRQGDTGELVEHVQVLLIARGYFCGGRIFSGRERADGEFGPATEVAVTDFQRACGIEPNGMVGSETMLALLMR